MTLDDTPELRTPEASDYMNEQPKSPSLLFDSVYCLQSPSFSRSTDKTSLAGDYKSILLTPSGNRIETLYPQSNIGRKTKVDNPFKHCSVPISHAAQIEKNFQAARTNLHLDMCFAASPTGSIDSRLPPDNGPFGQRKEKDPVTFGKTWRYSAAPNLFSDATLDVREPLPEVSPTLPAITTTYSDDCCIAMEPTSSGFASPLSAIRSCEDTEDELLPLPCSSPPTTNMFQEKVIKTDRQSNMFTSDIAALTQPMTGLKVGHNPPLDNEHIADTMDDSPIVDHLRRRSGGNCDYTGKILELSDTLFLSQSAKAAAESAKAKRGLLATDFQAQSIVGQRDIHSILPAHRQDSELNHDLNITSCPDSFDHLQLMPEQALQHGLAATQGHPHSRGDGTLAGRSRDIPNQSTVDSNQWISSSGRLLLFPRYASNPADSHINIPTPQSCISTSPSLQYREQSPNQGLRQMPQHTQRLSEQFRPGWCYSAKSSCGSVHPTANLYSFSTAAAKVVGESAAPDSRIRDSYRTDTLTPLARPPGRFKRTPVVDMSHGSETRHRGLARGVSPRSAIKKLQPKHDTFGSLRYNEARFRSSPLQPPRQYITSQITGKRGMRSPELPDFRIAENVSAVSISPEPRDGEGSCTDEDLRTAIRTSLYGSNMPECLQGAKEGIRELSPNVNIWRKGMTGGSRYRKKRRPSYWDEDLEEVRMSPAGRGGIASSPVMSKRSMVADLESVSSRADVRTDRHGCTDNVRISRTEFVEEVSENERAGIAELAV